MKKTVLSLEQALTLPYATQRFVQLGWRVIRLESAGGTGTTKPGDPNRYIGEDTGVDDLHSYYIAPNLGKEAITINLKKQEGRDLLLDLVRKLHVDVFLCNTLPKRYAELGIGFEALKRANPSLVWCGISAFGPDHPDAAGYDPALQAYSGYMFMTGEPDRDPMLCGIPIIDLKAGDEAFMQVLLALMQQMEEAHDGQSVEGREIHISMAQCAVSWLITVLPQLQFVSADANVFTRSGNEHRSFIPCNCYPTRDGYVYLAIGSDQQWEKLTRVNGFAHLNTPERKTNHGRGSDKENIYRDIRAGLQQYTTDEFIGLCVQNNLSVSPVHTTRDVAALDFVKSTMLKTVLPTGREVALLPASHPTGFLTERNNVLPCAPGLGEHNEQVLREAGYDPAQIRRFIDESII